MIWIVLVNENRLCNKISKKGWNQELCREMGKQKYVSFKAIICYFESSALWTHLRKHWSILQYTVEHISLINSCSSLQIWKKQWQQPSRNAFINQSCSFDQTKTSQSFWHNWEDYWVLKTNYLLDCWLLVKWTR